MQLGFTGRREGVTEVQEVKLLEYLNIYIYKGASTLHHGDCVGADALAKTLAAHLGLHIVCHPPLKDSLRAYTSYDELREAKDYLDRNRDIVDESDVVIALPPTEYDVGKGGTWYTINYALKTKTPVIIITPKGYVTET